MFRIESSNIQPIGVDIGHDSVKLLQLELRGSALAVHAWGRRMLDTTLPAEGPLNPAELITPQASQAIRELLTGGKFAGRSAVIALPRQIVHVKNLRLPPLPAAELASVINFEAREAFPFDTQEAHVDFLVAGEIRQGTDIRQEVVVLAAKNADVDRFVEQLHVTGLVIESLDVEPCALYRNIDRFVRRREDETEVNVIVDVGTRCTQVLIGKGRDISFFKAIDIGGADFNAAVSRKLDIKYDEARALRRRLCETEEGERPDTVRLAVLDATRSVMENLTREISLCMRYHSVTFRGQRPQKVRVGGGEGADRQLIAILQAALAIPVESARPLFNVDCAAIKGFDRRKPTGEWCVATGLALKRTSGKFAPLDGTSRNAPAAQIAPAQRQAAMMNDSPAPIVINSQEVVHA
jgi:type IV pilus assembly protein PilM